MENPIAQEIILDVYKPEYHIAVPCPLDYGPATNANPVAHSIVVLVYQFDRTLNRSVSRYVYKFAGAVVESFRDIGKADVQICPSCSSTNTFVSVVCIDCGGRFAPRK